MLEPAAGGARRTRAAAPRQGHACAPRYAPHRWSRSRVTLPDRPMPGLQPQPAAAATAPAAASRIQTREILGVPVAMTNYEGAVDAMDAMIEAREPGYVCAVAVHALTVGLDDPAMAEALRGAALVLPDGMPVVWAANLLGANLKDRVYGPELMLRYNDHSAERGHRIWLYGGRDQGSLVQLALNLRRRHPGINIVGGYSPPFRPMTDEEEDQLVDQINS